MPRLSCRLGRRHRRGPGASARRGAGSSTPRSLERFHAHFADAASGCSSSSTASATTESNSSPRSSPRHPPRGTPDPPSSKRTTSCASAIPGGSSPSRCSAGVCYVDRYAGSLAGIREKIPYFQELGLTYLHLMPLFESPEGNSDGGYAVSSYRRVDPRAGHDGRARRARGRAAAGGHLARRGLHLQPHQQRARVGAQGGRGRARVRGLLPHLPRPHDARCLRADRARDLPRRPPGLVRAAGGRALDLGDLLPLPVGPELCESRGVPRHGRRDAVPREPGRRDPADGCRRLHLEAPGHAVRVAARGAPAAAGVQRGAADGGALPAVQIRGDRAPRRGVEYISLEECQLSYNPLQMALPWEALATRDARLLQQALERRHALPPAPRGSTTCAATTTSAGPSPTRMPRSSASTATATGGSSTTSSSAALPGTFARGVPFQENPKTGDARVTGTTASLAGIEADDEGGVDRVILAHAIALSTGGIPLIYLGDEVAQLNDYSYVVDPATADDSRWVHRPAASGRPLRRAGRSVDGAGPGLQPADRADPRPPIDAGVRGQRAHRLRCAASDGARIISDRDRMPDPPASSCSPTSATIRRRSTPLTLSGFAEPPPTSSRRRACDLREGVVLPAHGFAWLRVTPI